MPPSCPSRPPVIPAPNHPDKAVNSCRSDLHQLQWHCYFSDSSRMVPISSQTPSFPDTFRSRRGAGWRERRPWSAMGGLVSRRSRSRHFDTFAKMTFAKMNGHWHGTETWANERALIDVTDLLPSCPLKPTVARLSRRCRPLASHF